MVSECLQGLNCTLSNRLVHECGQQHLKLVFLVPGERAEKGAVIVLNRHKGREVCRRLPVSEQLGALEQDLEHWESRCVFRGNHEQVGWLLGTISCSEHRVNHPILVMHHHLRQQGLAGDRCALGNVEPVLHETLKRGSAKPATPPPSRAMNSGCVPQKPHIHELGKVGECPVESADALRNGGFLVDPPGRGPKHHTGTHQLARNPGDEGLQQLQTRDVSQLRCLVHRSEAIR